MIHSTLTQQLAALIQAKPIAAADLEQAALFTLDAIANALAGRHTEPGRILLQWARNGGTDPGRRAFAMGALTHILEMDDLHRASVVHPGCVVVPAAWAVAERERADGKALLVAVLRGFEAAIRVGMAVGPAHYRIWHNTATCGPFGSAVAAASLLGLDVAATVHALGNAGTQSAGLWQFLETGAMTKHLHAGRGAEAGILAADLARLGFTGPPAILEGPKGFFAATCPDGKPQEIARDPDRPWELTQTSIKPWPSCRHTHPAMDAALELRPQLDPAGIERVEVETYQAALDVCDRPDPRTEYEAKFSLYHCVAAALTREAVDFNAFGPEARSELAGLRSRIAPRVVEPYASAYPRAWGSAVAVILKDGSRLAARRAHAKGDPETPLSRERLIEKSRMLMDYGGVEGAETLIGAILAMAEGGSMPKLPLAA